MALKGQPNGTTVPFAKFCVAFNFAGEQFWGRAARAPRSRKRFEALVIWGKIPPFHQHPFCMGPRTGAVPSGLGSMPAGFPALTCEAIEFRRWRDWALARRESSGHKTSGVNQFVEMVKLTVILAWVSTGSAPSKWGLKCHCRTASWAAEARM